MTPPRSHLFAGAVLALGGVFVGITALGLVAAQAVLFARIPGVVVSSRDAALLGDLLAVLPLIVTFAALNIGAAIGLMVGRGWAVPVASWVAAAAVAVGLLTLVLVIAGNGPATDADGLGIISVFVGFYAAAAIAVQVSAIPAFAPRRAPSTAA